MSELSEPKSHTGPDAEDSSLNNGISIAVAIAGTFMALTNVKDGNVSQSMQDAQASKINEWAYFQAKSTKQNIAEGTLEQLKSLKLLSSNASPEVLGDLDKKISEYQQKVERYEKEKAEIKAKAEGWQSTYEALNKIDDQFDLSDAAMSVGIALSGVSALVKRRSLFALAL
ncbi:MAG: DUF4337 domain-containing protein, partial [Verrucomicrobia bacterium]|nr:DUF4337 domain-containing protein [Verrucomicrobiota bacterium]